MYRILHADGKEYGPVSAEVIRKWIAEGRLNKEINVRPEGSDDWQPLSSLAEFASDLGGAPPPASAGRPAISPGGPTKTSGMAITSLVLGILGIVTCGVTSLFGAILGIIALVRINKSQGHLSGNGLAIAGIVTSGLFVLFIPIYAAMLLPALAKAKSKAQTITCVNNLKQLGLAVVVYAGDNKDAYPPPATWCDVTANYRGTDKVLQCPTHLEARCGYAYNTNLFDRQAGEVAPNTVMIFESDAGWNAAGGPELMITQPRHGGVFNVCFADGSVQQLQPAELGSLRWEP